MIDPKSLTNSDKQREVKYKGHDFIEFGYITSWNENFIFVRYHGRIHRIAHVETHTEIYNAHSKATRPQDLEFADYQGLK